MVFYGITRILFPLLFDVILYRLVYIIMQDWGEKVNGFPFFTIE
jgi:hypothetical protein